MSGIVDDIFIKGFVNMGRDHDATLNNVLRICRQANLKLNKTNAFSVYKHTILCGGTIMTKGELGSKRGAGAEGHAPHKCKNKMQSLPNVVKYLSKYSPMTAEICKTIQKLTSVKMEWLWNDMYQDL